EDDEEDPEEDDDEDPEEDEVDADDEEDPEEDDDEDPEEDEAGDGEEEEMEIGDEMDNPKVIDPVEPPPPIFQFGHNFHVGESSSTRALLDGNSMMFAPGPKPSDLMTIHSRTTKLEKQMFERYKTEIKIKEKFKEDDLHMNRHKLDVTTKYSKMERLVEGLSKQINKLKFQCSRVECLSQWEAGIRGRILAHLRFREESPIYTASAPRVNDPYVMVRDAAMAAREDDDDDITAPRDPQPSEPRRSLRGS
ncbi:hypothetical protein Tco_0648593, partial [Tanacetum coccineum]